MRDMIGDVKRFMEVAGQDVGQAPILPSCSVELAHDLKVLGEKLVGFADELKRGYPNSLAARRSRFKLEELGETMVALAEGDVAGVADGIADSLYVNIGEALAYGIPLGKVWDEVQRANLTKFPRCVDCEDGFDDAWDDGVCRTCKGKGRIVLKDEAGKVIKPEGWTPPDIEGVLARDTPVERMKEELDDAVASEMVHMARQRGDLR